MFSFKDGYLNIKYDSFTIAKEVYLLFFVLNVVSIFALYNISNVSVVISFALVAVSIFLIIINSNKRIIIPYNFVWFAVLVAYAAMTNLWSNYFYSQNFNVLIKLVTTLIIGTSMSFFVDNEDDLEKLINAFMFATLICIALELSVTPLGSLNKTTFGSKFSGCNANSISVWFSCSALMAFYKAYIKEKRLSYILVGIFFLASLLTGSRKAFITCAVGFVLMILFDTKKRWYGFRLVSMFLIAFLMYEMIMNIQFFYNIIGYRIEKLISYAGGANSDASIDLRLFYIEQAKRLFKESPLFGKGFGNFAQIVSQDHSIATYSHNNYWQILSEMGLVGFAIYYSIYIVSFFRLFKSALVRKSSMDILFLTILISFFIMEIGLVTILSKFAQIVLAMVFISAFIEKTDCEYSYK